MRDQHQGHALLVGAPGAGLKAVEHDVRKMAEMLGGRGFAVDVRTGERSTREGILAGYDALIANSRSGMPAVFYYSGHGWYAVVENEQPRSWQGISSADMSATDTDDFRGITAWELSIKQAQLTQKTRNVTVILDCCYAAQMSRDGAACDAVPRALPHPFRRGFAAHLRALRERYGAAFDAVEPLGNRDAVRLVACGQAESAFEYQADGEHRGAFTDALLAVLAEVGDARVSWAAIEDAIRARVHRRFLVQRPMIEGPARRLLFSLDEGEIGDAVQISAVSGELRLDAGCLMGVTVGDVYAVMPPGSRTYRAADAITEVEVRTSKPMVSLVVLRDKTDVDPARLDGATAFPIEKRAIRRAVRLDVPASVWKAVTQEVDATRILRVAEAEDTTAVATLRAADGGLTIEDRAGPLFPATRFPEDLPLAIERLANLGAAQGLRELEGDRGVLTSEIEIEWGTVDRGEMWRMPEHGGALALRDKLYVKITSKADRKLYAHVFNIGIGGIIKLLTHANPTGVLLRSDTPDWLLGQNFDGTLQGLPLSWPGGIPRDTFPRTDEIVVIVTSAPAHLRGLETAKQRCAARGPGSKLEDLLAQLQDGLPRTTRSTEPIDGFLVKRLSYLLHPRDARMADIPFEIDDNPRQVAARAAEAWITTPGDSAALPASAVVIAIEIADLVTENRRMLPGDLQIDALICTRSTSTTGGYATWTHTCRANDPLPPGLMFRGPVCDFVDIYLWVSRHTENCLTLAQLLAQRATAPDVQDAAGALSIAAGSSAPWVAAVGASTVMARIAHELLVGEAGVSVGLYRTSFLAREQFGVGRHPRQGLHHGEVSFSLHIERVGLERPRT